MAIINLNLEQTYAYNASFGAITSPRNGSWVCALAVDYYGITEPVSYDWYHAIAVHLGVTTPVNDNWIQTLCDYYSITEPVNGSWLWALATHSFVPPVAPFIWDQNTELWEAEVRTWSLT